MDADRRTRLTPEERKSQLVALGFAEAGLEHCDPAETALLAEMGYHAVLAVGVRSADRGYLLEIFAWPRHQLAAVAPHVRVLANYCAAVGV